MIMALCFVGGVHSNEARAPGPCLTTRGNWNLNGGVATGRARTAQNFKLETLNASKLTFK